MPRETHFIVRVTVERVDRVTPDTPAASRGALNSAATEPKAGRVVTELANLTVKANSVEALIDKAEAHMHLVEDIAATDPRAEVGKRG